MASAEEGIDSTTTTKGQDLDVADAAVDTLRPNALGNFAVLFAGISCVAPMAALFFNVPGIASQAGAAVPLVMVLAAIGVACLAFPIVFFARRLSSTAGFYTWISHGLGQRSGFVAGWLMIGAYALFEAASQAAFGGLADINVSTFFNVHVPGGWVTYALISIVVVSVLAYFDVRWSTRVLAVFATCEILSLVLLDLFITLKGGAAGHDLLHTFTLAGSTLKGVAPGGLLGVGVGMALAVWSFVGFESAASFGEEARQPHRAIPAAVFGIVIAMIILYVWTTYSAVIGLGWLHAGDTLGNLSIAPEPYYRLAGSFVGTWLADVMAILVTTSTFASCIVFHNAMARYLYAMGREEILPARFGKTHPRWKSPVAASILQSIFTLIVILFLALVIQKSNADGSVSYALGFADGKVYQQTGGIGTYQWLAIIGTISLIVVYLLTNLAAPLYARRERVFKWFTHIIAPVISSVVLLIPLASFVLPPIPGIGGLFISLGFAPTPFPLNILPVFPIIWIVGGLIYIGYLARRAPERYKKLGRIMRIEE